MTEEELEALANDDGNGQVATNNEVETLDEAGTSAVTPSDANTQNSTTGIEEVKAESNEGEKTEVAGEEAPNEEGQETKVVDETKRQKQGERIGFVLLGLLIIGVIAMIIFSLNKDKFLGITHERPQVVQNQEEPEVEEDIVVDKKKLTEPDEDSGVLKDDIRDGTFYVEAYIAKREEGAKWFKCDSCKPLLKAIDIYVNMNNDVYYIGEDGYLYVIYSNGRNLYEPVLLDSSMKFSKIFNTNLLRGEDGIYYSYVDTDEGEVLKSTNSTIPSKLSSHNSLKAVNPFRPNINDKTFTLGLDERYYTYFEDKVYLIDNDGEKSDLLFTLGNDEELIFINGNVIKTTKMIYSIQSKETSQGFDYKFYPDNITKYYGQVKYYNNNIVIDSRNNVYYYGVEKGGANETD